MTKDWHDLAACREPPDGMTPEQWANIFVPDKPRRGRTKFDRYAGARMVCAACPVTVECLAEGDELGDKYGFRGGMSPRERTDYDQVWRVA